MCVIAFASAGVSVKMSSLRNCFDSNPHGAGIMWRDGKVVHVRKGFMSWEAFAEAYKTVPTDCDRAFHFRIMSSGNVTPENCHPFTVGMETCLDYTTTRLTIVHNGVMHAYENSKLPWPDTVNYLREHEREFPNVPQVWGNKFLFMTPTQSVMIGNGWEMPEDENVWYSNDSYEAWGWGNFTQGKGDDKDVPEDDSDFPIEECTWDCYNCKHYSTCGQRGMEPVTEDDSDFPIEECTGNCQTCKHYSTCWNGEDSCLNEGRTTGDNKHQQCYGDCDNCENPDLCWDLPEESSLNEGNDTGKSTSRAHPEWYRCPTCDVDLTCIKAEEDEHGYTKWGCPNCAAVYYI